MSDRIIKFGYQDMDSLSLPAERGAFAVLKTWLTEIADDLKITDKTKNQLLIAADEIFSNIARCAYPNDHGRVQIDAEYDQLEQTLTVIFSDSGIAFDPLTFDGPDVSKPLAERRAGGLGIFIVKQLTDSVEYRRENNQNILTLKKRINGGTVQ